MNDWFDVFNVSVPVSDTRARKKGYGLALDDQKSILTEMSKVISEMKVIGHQSKLPFQKGNT